MFPGAQKVQATSTLVSNPNMQVCFSEQLSHSSSCSLCIIFPVSRRRSLCPSTSGISEEANGKLTHTELVPGASYTEPVNRKLQVHSAGILWSLLLCLAAMRLTQINWGEDYQKLTEPACSPSPQRQCLMLSELLGKDLHLGRGLKRAGGCYYRLPAYAL